MTVPQGSPRTLAEKVWDAHVVRRAEGEPDLLFIDLHLVHEVTSPQAFDGLRLAGRTVRRPDRTLATADHNVPTDDTPTVALIKDELSRVPIQITCYDRNGKVVKHVTSDDKGDVENPDGNPDGGGDTPGGGGSGDDADATGGGEACAVAARASAASRASCSSVSASRRNRPARSPPASRCSRIAATIAS